MKFETVRIHFLVYFRFVVIQKFWLPWKRDVNDFFSLYASYVRSQQTAPSLSPLPPLSPPP